MDNIKKMKNMDLKKWYSIPGLVLAGAFLIFAFIMVNKSVEASHEFKEEKNKIAVILNFKDRLLSFRDWVFSETAWEEKRVQYEATLDHAEEEYNKALGFGHYLIFGCLIFFVTVVAIYARKRIYFGITLGLATVGIALLAQGVMNPILEMSAFEEDMAFKVYVKPKDIPYYMEAIDQIEEKGGMLGEVVDHFEIIPFFGEDIKDGLKKPSAAVAGFAKDVGGFMREHADEEYGKDQVFKGKTYFYYQNKGIMDVITLLWENNNKPVALAIGTFSVIVPLIKLLFSIIILLFPITRAKTLRKILSYISKWSMADVFVVGAFLAYLSFANMSPGVQMDANVLFGLYYFGGYVIVSILLGIMLDLTIKEKIKIIERKKASENTDSEEGNPELV